MKTFSCTAAFIFLMAVSTLSLADETLRVASFAEAKRPDDWRVTCGHWEPENGVLVCRELEADKHAAASRWQIPMRDGVIKLKLKFAGAKGFHLGFDPAAGQLKKTGHLYSLIVTPSGAQIKKHKDKSDSASKDATLATASQKLPDGWIDVTLTTVGDKVTATVGDGIKLEASDPTFHVAKPTVVFRVLGGDVQLDDVSVTVTKAGESAAPKKNSK